MSKKTPTKWRNSKKHGKKISYYNLGSDESVYVFFRWRDKDYKRKIGLRKADSISEKLALSVLEQWKAKVKGVGSLQEEREMTFDALWKYYLIYAKSQKLVSREQVIGMYEKHLRDQLENMIVSQINDMTIFSLQGEMVAKEYKESYINTVMGVIHRVIAFGISHGLIKYNPIRKYKPLRKTHNYDEYLSLEQVEELKKEVTHDKELLAFVSLSVGIGARTSAVLNICGRDIKGDKIQLYDGKRKMHYTIKMTSSLVEFVKDVPRDFNKIVGRSSVAIPRGKIYYRLMKYINPMFNKNRPKNNRIRLHTLRHSYASHLAQRGVPLSVIQVLLNHASPLTTKRYEHLTDGFVDGWVK